MTVVWYLLETCSLNQIEHICFQSNHVHCYRMLVLICWRCLNHSCLLINNMYTTMLSEQKERSTQQTDNAWTTRVHALRRWDNPFYDIEFSLCIYMCIYIYILLTKSLYRIDTELIYHLYTIRVGVTGFRHQLRIQFGDIIHILTKVISYFPCRVGRVWRRSCQHYFGNTVHCISSLDHGPWIHTPVADPVWPPNCHPYLGNAILHVEFGPRAMDSDANRGPNLATEIVILTIIILVEQRRDTQPHPVTLIGFWRV